MYCIQGWQLIRGNAEIRGPARYKTLLPSVESTPKRLDRERDVVSRKGKDRSGGRVLSMTVLEVLTVWI